MCRTFLGFVFSLTLFAGFAQAQFRFGGGGPPGGGMMGSDPAKTFDFLSRGRPFFLISETRSLREPLTQYAKEKGITNDQITRDQFVAFMSQMKAKMPAPGSAPVSPGGPPGFAPSGTTPPSSVAAPAPGAPGSTDFFTKLAETEFKRRDDNGDGKLNRDEMSSSLRRAIDEYDRNKDSLIDYEEFKVYFLASMVNRGNDSGSSGNNPQAPKVNPVHILIEDDSELRPTVIRVGKLPKDLPSWFNELDADLDGQVALYEWRKGGKDLDEYKEWDRNDDAVITPEEALRKITLASNSSNKSGSTTPSTSASPSRVPGGSGGPPSFGGFDRSRFGSGGPPGGFGGFKKKDRN